MKAVKKASKRSTMERFENLDRFEIQAWDLLIRAAHGRSDSMRTPMMATYDGRQCQLRTIVLRAVDKQRRQLLFFTDARSSKVEHLRQHPQTALTFWHPKKKVQLRVSGEAELISGDDQARKYWDHLSKEGRSSYATVEAPGTFSEKDTDGLPGFWSQELDKSQTDFAFDHFMLIRVTVHSIDALHLHPEGHQRAAFWWEKDKRKQTWLVP